MKRKSLALIRSVIFIALILSLLSAYTLAGAPAVSGSRNGNAQTGWLNRLGIQTQRAFAATPGNDSYGTDEGNVLNVAAPGILTNDTPDGTVTAINVVTYPTAGVLTDPLTDGSFSFDPSGQFEDLAGGEPEDVTFTYTVTDAAGPSTEATVTITITGVNDLPVITEGESKTVDMSEDGSPTPFTLTLNATDVEGDTLTWSILTQATNGTATASGDGNSKTIGYTPNPNYNGTDSFVVQVDDGNSGTDTITVNVNIAAQNDPPVITEGESINRTMDEDGSPIAFGLTLNATDVDNGGDTLTWSIISQATNGTATASGTGSSKVIGYTPTANYNGADSFVVQVADSNGGTDTITVNVTIDPQSDPPIITEGTSKSVDMSEDGSPTPFSLTLNATDADGDTLTWSISTPASHGTAMASGDGNSNTIGYTPTLNYFGTDSFVVQVSDGTGNFDAITVNVNIAAQNDPPVITEGESKTVDMDEDGSPTPFSLILNATDVDSSTLTWSISTLASHGTATASGTGPSKTINYTPNPNYNGTDSFVVQVSDGNGGTDTITVNVTIDPQSDPPIITEGTSKSVDMSEDSSPLAFSLTLNATDTDGDTLTWSISTQASHGNATASGTGSSKIIGYTPTSNYFGTDSFVVQVADGTGNSDKITVNVNIASVNDAPAGLPDIYEVNQGSTLTVAAPGVLDNDSDQDGDPITAEKLTDPAHGTLTFQSNGSFTYTPSAGFIGEDTFTYQVKDSVGATSLPVQVDFTVKDASSPSVVWKEPISDGGQVDVNGEVVTLMVEATDDVSVDYVRFYRWDPNFPPSGGFVDIGIDDEAPFEIPISTSILNYTWNQIFARAYDNTGNESGRKWIWLYRVPPTNFLFIPLTAGK